MQILPENKALIRQRLLRLNILVAACVFIVSFVLMISGDYATLQEREAADGIYNLLIIGSVLYMVGTWMFCVFSKPFWYPQKGRNKDE